MTQHANTHRFGPDVWVTVASTGEHVKVELLSQVANAYRVRSSANGVQFYQDDELNETAPHPGEDAGRHWSRCRGTGCGAPLTAELTTCETCQAPVCTCGRCACSPAIARRAKAARTKKAAKKTAKKAQPQPEVEAATEEVEDVAVDDGADTAESS
jgi:hypothetical protein